MTTNHPALSDQPLTDLEVTALLGDAAEGDVVVVDWPALYQLVIASLERTASSNGDLHPHRAMARVGVHLAGAGNLHRVRTPRGTP